jgi:hypothetical protein
MSWSFRARKTVRLGPFFWSFSQNGFTSWGFRIFGWTRNVTRGTDSIDTPGIGGIRRRRQRG